VKRIPCVSSRLVMFSSSNVPASLRGWSSEDVDESSVEVVGVSSASRTGLSCRAGHLAIEQPESDLHLRTSSDWVDSRVTEYFFE